MREGQLCEGSGDLRPASLPTQDRRRTRTGSRAASVAYRTRLSPLFVFERDYEGLPGGQTAVELDGAGEVGDGLRAGGSPKSAFSHLDEQREVSVPSLRAKGDSVGSRGHARSPAYPNHAGPGRWACLRPSCH